MHSFQELNKSGTSIWKKSWWFLPTSIPKKLEETYPLSKGIGWEWSPKTHD
jgi:hypothetical protein